jgi:hypothetical protein
MGPCKLHIYNYDTSGWAYICDIYKITVLADGPIEATYTNLQD